MKYKVIRVKEIDVLQRNVNNYLDNGWSLIGGICFANDHYMQALTFNINS